MCFSVFKKVDLALDYASGSSKNDVTMTEQVSIAKRAKFIVRNKLSAPYAKLAWNKIKCHIHGKRFLLFDIGGERISIFHDISLMVVLSAGPGWRSQCLT